MKQLLCVFYFITIIITSQAQDKDFDLSRYKFPDFKRHEMELDFSSFGYTSKHSYDELTAIGDEQPVRNDYSQIHSRSNFSVRYQYEYLTRARMDQFYSSLSGWYTFDKTNNPTETIKQFDPNFNWNFGGFRRYYLEEDKFFLEAGTSLAFSLFESKRTVANVVGTRNRENTTIATISLGAGFGRMEETRDLWQTYLILSKLEEQKSLSRELKESDIFEFATFASKLKNRRFFDFRLQKIKELKALDSLLHQQGLITDNDISYFNVLNDYWSFTYFNSRKSGKVLKFWLSPEYSRHYHKSLNTDPQTTSYTNLVSALSFDCHQQLNLFWERHMNIVLSNKTLIDQSTSGLDNYPSNMFSSNTEFGYGFFPNERTSFSGVLGYQGNQNFNQDSSTKYWSSRIYTGLDGNYYISPQLQINAGIRFSYTDKIHNSINPTTFDYNLGLRYAIF